MLIPVRRPLVRAAQFAALGTALCCLLLGCKNDKDIVGPKLLTCIIEDPTDFTELQQCVLPPGDTSWCELIDIDDVWFLNEDSKAWLPQYCLDEGNNVQYRNELGQQLEFSVTRQNAITRTGHNGFDQCASDSTKAYWYCSKSETLSVSLTNADLDIRFNIIIGKEVERPIQQDYRLGDAIEIWLWQNSPFNIEQLFHHVVEQGDLDYTAPINLEYFESLELGGYTFSEVYSMYFTSPFEKDYQVYYNKSFGLIAFNDPDDHTWVLQ